MNVYSTNDLGRIEMVPEVITTISHHAVINVPGVTKIGEPPSSSALFRRNSSKKEGILLEMVDQQLVLEIYVHLLSDVNMVETCRSVQGAVIEAIDQMIGLPVKSVNVHVTDVTYQSAEIG
ncbi:MAG: Asp23/Gls24 family envelope stress response protein [Chloroflexota bacterium]